MHPKLLDKLAKRQSNGTFRALLNLESYIDFYSNDYLGYACDENTTVSISGSTGSRLISGNSDQAEKCEVFLSNHFRSESALVFNSGYAANLGLLSSIPQRGDIILYDERIHASAKEGIRLSFADSFSFKHHDYEDLERQLNKFSHKLVYVVVEALYSMDGTMAHFRRLTNLCSDYQANLIVDEAHSAGVFGEEGRGVVAAMDLENQVFARLVTFGKAYGIMGAAILGSQNLRNYLINFARSFIYTTALPPEIYAIIHRNVGSENIELRLTKLHENIAYFRSAFNHSACVSEINSPIQIIQFGDINKTKQLSEILLENRLAVKPIFSPTVPEGSECLRICLHSFDQKSDIDQLIEVLKSELV
jgi:8-amino-7-oxononanoate synthase